MNAAGDKPSEDALVIARGVMTWWAEAQSMVSTTGDGDERNVFDHEPSFVSDARALLGRAGERLVQVRDLHDDDGKRLPDEMVFPTGGIPHPGVLVSERRHPRASAPALDESTLTEQASAPDWIELRPDADGGFDEIVARFADGMVHVETLDDRSVYVGFYKPADGPTASGLQLWISSKGILNYVHEDIAPAPAR